jgi:hypothetical protein
MDFLHEMVQIRDIPDPESDGGDIKGIAPEWDNTRVGQDGIALQGLLLQSSPEHFHGEIDGNRLGPLVMQKPRKVACPAAEIDHQPVSNIARETKYVRAPSGVYSRGQNAIEQIVCGND